MKLYDHESVPLRYTIDLTSKPDIDGAVDALAKFFRINVLQLRIKLLLTVIQSNRDEGQTEMITKNITEIIKRCNGPETETDLSEIDLYKYDFQFIENFYCHKNFIVIIMFSNLFTEPVMQSNLRSDQTISKSFTCLLEWDLTMMICIHLENDIERCEFYSCPLITKHW